MPCMKMCRKAYFLKKKKKDSTYKLVQLFGEKAGVHLQQNVLVPCPDFWCLLALPVAKGSHLQSSLENYLSL